MKIYELFLTIYFWTITIIALFFTFIICSLAYLFVDQKTFARLYVSIPGYILLYSMTVPGFWSLTIKDVRKDKSWDKQYVVVANHVSFIDSLVMAIIPLKLKFMLGKIFADIPVFGWLAKSSGFVPVDRHDKELCKTAVERAVKTIQKDNSSFAIYPEGIRSLKPYNFSKFKTGAYRIAYQTKLPILPITLKGTAEGMRIGGIVGLADIEIIIDEPFLVENEEYQFYIQKTRDIIESHL